MPYKTVLVHCNDKSRMARVLAPATQVAAGFKAHLIGLSVTPPVVIIPTGMPGAPDTMVIEGPQRDVGDRVLVAWNAHREAARAVFDALPLLQRVREVRVIWVNPQSEGELVQDIPAADICTALARHGVKCEATQAVQPHTNVGQTLLAQAKDCAADLLVMGCYGHSRLREFVLGGASEHILRHMSIPVLMAH
jgi:nucleotide-binding universal stress UspA family protein